MAPDPMLHYTQRLCGCQGIQSLEHLPLYAPMNSLVDKERSLQSLPASAKSGEQPAGLPPEA